MSTIAADGSGEVDSLYVSPSHRGRGVGHAMMTRTMEWFDGEGVRTVTLDVIDGNDAAIRFYERFGFVPRTVRLVRKKE